MAGIKYQEDIAFKDSHVYILMDDEWGVEIVGSDKADGPLTGMGTWDFSNRDAWISWGNFCTERIHELKEKWEKEEINDTQLLNLIYEIDDAMKEDVKQYLIYE